MRQADVGQQRSDALLLRRFQRTARELSVFQRARVVVAPGTVGSSSKGRYRDGVTPARVGLACETRQRGRWDKLSDRPGLAPATLRRPVDAPGRSAGPVRAGGTAPRGRGRAADPRHRAPLATSTQDNDGERV